MPLYEFACKDCQAEPELLIRTADEVPQCPECGSERLIKLLSVPTARVGGGAEPPPTGPCGGSCACFPGE